MIFDPPETMTCKRWHSPCRGLFLSLEGVDLRMHKELKTKYSLQSKFGDCIPTPQDFLNNDSCAMLKSVPLLWHP
jgi:hypothetical protein